MINPGDGPTNILILIAENFNLAATVGFIDPLRAANYLEGRQYFTWTLASERGGDCLASNGLSLAAKPLSEVRGDRFDLVVVSTSWAPESSNSKSLQSALWRWYREGSTLAGLDTGAFVLAEAGLLDGKRATAHYEHIDALAELYPQVTVSEDIYVFDGRLASCCGGIASTDFSLAMIQGALGDSLGNAVARYIFKGSFRPAETRQSLDLVEPLGKTTPGMVRAAIAVMEANLEDPCTIPEICSRIGVSQRHLNRQFSHYIRKSPALYYRDIRLDRARGLVTQTELPMAHVAQACGFNSQIHFSRAYSDRFGLPPSRDRIEGRVPFEFRAWPMHRNPKQAKGRKSKFMAENIK